MVQTPRTLHTDDGSYSKLIGNKGSLAINKYLYGRDVARYKRTNQNGDKLMRKYTQYKRAPNTHNYK